VDSSLPDASGRRLRQVRRFALSSDVRDSDDAVDHVRGPSTAHLILEYGDYECPYWRLAYRQIHHVEEQLGGDIRFAWRHFPLTDIHPHALAASLAAESAGRQGRFWDMHDLLFHRQKALPDDLRGYGAQIGLDLDQFDADRTSEAVREGVRRDADSGLAPGHVHGTPTLFIDGAIHRGDYAANTLLERLTA
jgi:protein-disulfide isomerase